MFSIICVVLFLICKLNNLAFLFHRIRTRKATRSQSCTNNIAETLPSSSIYSLSVYLIIYQRTEGQKLFPVLVNVNISRTRTKQHQK